MLILFGLLGLLQSTLLPGLLIRKAVKLHGGITEQLIYIFPLSLIVNYLLIFFLAWLHLYIRPVIFGLITIELILLLWLYRKTLLSPVGKKIVDISENFRKELRPLGDYLNNLPSEMEGMVKVWIWLLSGCFALSGVVWGLHLCRLNFGTIFSGWDTLFSWNRYALIWTGGEIPDIGGMYPQLLPVNWSLSYLLQGEGAVQFFNTLLPPLFFLWIQLMLFDLGFQRKESAFFFAAVIARFMMKKLMGDQLFDGYMDVPVAAISLLGFYSLMRIEKSSFESQHQAVFLSMIFAAGAVITKQSGIAALIVVPLTIGLLMKDGLKTFSRGQKLVLTGLVLLIVLPWYLHCFLYNTHGYERELIAEGIRDFNQQYNIQHRLRLAADTLGKYGVCFVLSLAGLPFVPKRYRFPFSLMIWPLTIIWAVSYSYDARNLGPVLPFVSLLCGFAVAGIGSFAARLCKKSKLDRISLAVCCVIVAIAVCLVFARTFPDEKLREDQRTKQKALFGERLNQELLYNVFGETHEGFDIYTDYPAWFLPGYEECCSAAELTDTFQVNQALEMDKINWLLLPMVMPNNTDPSKELIIQCILEGKCEQISCSDGYYKSYCLYQINR